MGWDLCGLWGYVLIHPHFPEEHADSVRAYLGFLKLSLKKHYDGPAAVVTIREDESVTEVTVNDVPVFRVLSDRKGTRWTHVVQDWEPAFGK